MCLTMSPVEAHKFERFPLDEMLEVSLTISPEDWNALRYQHRSAEFYPKEGCPSWEFITPVFMRLFWCSDDATRQLSGWL